MFENDIVNASFDSNVFELTDRAISKASALMFLAHRKQWDKQKIAVFGDGGNDMDMLMSFVHSYAPENAQEQVKKVVSEIIASNDQYGVLKKIMPSTISLIADAAWFCFLYCGFSAISA